MKSTIWKTVIIIFAVIGLLAMIGLLGMLLMHGGMNGMMGSMAAACHDMMAP
jgi:hypothetical protein